MDPYTILGIPHDSSMKDVKNAYKQLVVKVHPDKLGDSTLFNTVHNAYAIIREIHSKAHKTRDAPAEKQSYSSKGMPCEPRKMKNFTIERFNRYFDKHRINGSDPYADGYGKVMASSSRKREDVAQASQEKVHIPTYNVVLYKEPECLASSKVIANCAPLGQDTVNDFTGGGGTDIMRAFAHKNGDNLDTVRRYSSVDEVLAARSGESLEMTEHEQRRIERRQRKLEKLEALRQHRVHKDDEYVSKRYTTLHTRLQ